MIKIEKLNPFGRMCISLGMLPSSYKESLTYEEQLLWFFKYLEETVIPTVNNNADAVEELQALYLELKTYVDNYFTNLDVQQEINNKLDQMAESGQLEEIIAQFLNYQVDNTLVNYLNLKQKSNIEISELDLYNNISHTYQQGMCVINDSNIMLALANQEGLDNNIKLIEYNTVTKTIIRSVYLPLYHANSLTYDKTNGKIYVAFCNQTNEGITTPNNNIGVINYTTLNLENIITPNNLPEDERIRSVYYDNENNILYGGNYFTIYKFNNLFNIIETINLSTQGINTTIADYNLNQTYKVKDNKIYGLFMSFIGIWKIDGTLLKIINLNSPLNLENIGEYEDFDFLSNGNVLIVSTKKYSFHSTERITSIYESNFIKNIDVNLPFTRLNIDTNNYDIYVDINYNGEEVGINNKPFKSLQKAINLARQIKTSTRIFIKAGTYPTIYLNGVNNVQLVPEGQITIDGIQIFRSSLFLYNPDYDVKINSINIQNSKVTMRTTANNGKIDIYTNSNTSYFYNACCNITYNSQIVFQKVNFIGNNIGNCIDISQSKIMLNECTFTNYQGHYAFVGERNAIINTYQNTYNEPTSSTQHNYVIRSGSILTAPNGEQYKNDIVIESQAFEFSSLRWLGGVEGNGYTGKIVSNYDTHYNAIIVKCRTSGTTAKSNYFLIPLLQGNAYTINGQWLNANYNTSCMICFNKENNDLVIEYNRISRINHNTKAIEFFNYGDSGSPADSQFMQIQDIGYVNI